MVQELNLNIMTNGREIHWHHKKRRNRETGKHHQDFYEVCLVLDGIAKNDINDKSYFISKYDMIFINKNTVHEIISNDEDHSLKYINIAFGESYMERIKMIFSNFTILKDAEIFHLSHDKANHLLNLYSNINLNLSYDEALIEVELYLYHMIKEIVSLNMNQNKMYPKWFENLLDEFDNPESLNAGVSHLFNISPYSKQYTIKIFKNYINVTPTEYINLRRIECATQLLIKSKLSITDICYEVGFQNLEYFDRTFKKYKGFTPLQYRKEMYRLIGESNKV